MRENENSAFFQYGSKLITLGKMFQNPETKLTDLISVCHELGLIISFRLEPDPAKSIEIPSEE